MASGAIRLPPKIYFSPTALGLASGATMSAVAQAMPNGSIGIYNTTDVDESEMTLNKGLVNVILMFKVTEMRTFAFGARAYGSINLANARIFYGAFQNNSKIWLGWKEFTFSS